MTAIAYKFYDGAYGAAVGQPTDSDSAAKLELGSIVKGHDTSSNAYGEAEFVYVKFTGTVAAGDFVVVDGFAKTATQTPTSATKGRIGVSMAAQASGTYGWVLIRGVHDAANVLTATAAGSLLSGSTTAGRASSAVANYSFDVAICKTLAASNVATVELYWPGCSGR